MTGRVPVMPQIRNNNSNVREEEVPGEGIYLSGRCHAITGKSTRCKHPCVITDASLCHIHRQQRTTLTIDLPPRELARRMGPRSGQCCAVRNDGKRCDTKTWPDDHVCGVHYDSDVDLVESDEGELDQELIDEAITFVEEHREDQE